MITSPEKLVPINAAAKVYGLTRFKLKKLIELGRLPAVNTSTGSRPTWHVRICDLEEALKPRLFDPEAAHVES